MTPSTTPAPRTQVACEEAKRIVSDVRWDYGPYSHVEVIPGPMQAED